MPPSIANLLELGTPSRQNTPVQAYAKLEFGAYSFYVQSLSVTLGRKANSEKDHVDVHLGNTRGISRQHARVQYSFARNCFEIYVGGRNGLFVDDIFYDQGSVVALDDRTQVQIGEIKFNFLLPHQGTLPEDHQPKSSDSESEEETPSTPSSLTTTPPPDSLTANPEPSTTTSTAHDPSTGAASASATAVEKPDIPYATLIAQSLLSHPRRRRTLQEIYAWIQDHHAYFKGKNKSWQSSIRHNLMSSPAFVCYGPRPGEVDTGESKKSKRGKDEWGISPEYEGLIGDLSAKEGDTDKLSTKLTKKKASGTGEKTKPEKEKVEKVKEEKETKEGKTGKANQGTTTRDPKTTSPAPQSTTQTDDRDKSKLEELVKNMQGKGVDMGALLQEALAKMKGIPGLPMKPPIPNINANIHSNINTITSPATATVLSAAIVQPPTKRLKHTFPPNIASTTPATSSIAMTPHKPNPNMSNTTSNPGSNTGVPPIQMPMPLPYAAAKVAPIPVVGATSTAGPQIKQEFPPLQAPVPSLGSQMPVMGQIPGSASMTGQVRAPSTTPSIGGLGSPSKVSESTVSPEPTVPGKVTPAHLVAPGNAPGGIATQNGQVATRPSETAASKRSPRGKKRGLPE